MSRSNRALPCKWKTSKRFLKGKVSNGSNCGTVQIVVIQQRYGSALFSLEKLKSSESCPLCSIPVVLFPVDLQQENRVIPRTAVFFTLLARSRYLCITGRTPQSKAHAFCYLKAVQPQGKVLGMKQTTSAALLCHSPPLFWMSMNRSDVVPGKPKLAEWSSGWWVSEMAAWWASELFPLKFH